jgi:hypothetical protein
MGMMMEAVGLGGLAAIHRDATPLGVFYWSIETRVNAGSNSAKIAEAACGLFREVPGRPDKQVTTHNARVQGGIMADLLNLAMLICASVGAMAFGLLAAYGILRAGFGLMRPKQKRVAVKTRAEVARVS